jgi:CBS domain-containing protein
VKLKNAGLDSVIRNAITVTDTMSLLEAREVLLKHRVGRLPVLDKNKKPVGIVTEKDFVRAIYKFGGKMVDKILVRDFMSKNLITITKKNTIHDCAKLMQSHKISSVLVLEGNRLIGIITKTDLASVFLTQSVAPLKVSQIMTKDVISVMPADSLLLVESLLVKHKISRIVVQRNKKPVGIITNRDFIPAKMPRWIRDWADPKEVKQYQLSQDEFKMNQLSYILSFRAEDIMTANPATIDSDEQVSSAVLIMIRNGISGLPVVKNGNLCGIITKSDIVRAISTQ